MFLASEKFREDISNLTKFRSMATNDFYCTHLKKEDTQEAKFQVYLCFFILPLGLVQGGKK